MREDVLLKIAKNYLDKGLNKDFYLHTTGVLRAAKSIIESDIGDSSVVIPAAIFHDTGWSFVPSNLQGNSDPESIRKGMEMHLIKGAEIARKELKKIGYDEVTVKRIEKAIKSHKYSKPDDINAKILIDADNLSDIYLEQFKSDLISYDSTPEKLIEYRSKNTFYTRIAKNIFDKELARRKTEYKINLK